VPFIAQQSAVISSTILWLAASVRDTLPNIPHCTARLAVFKTYTV